MQKDHEKTHSAKCRRRRRVFRTFLVVLFVAFVCLRIALKVQIWRGLNAIKEKGEPLTVEELNARTGKNTNGPIPQSYRIAVAACESPAEELRDALSFRFGPLAHSGEPLPYELRAAIAEYVNNNSKALQHLDVVPPEAALYFESIDDCNDPAITLHSGFVVYAPTAMQSAATLLFLRAMLKADEGDTCGAVNSLLSALRVIQSLGTKPTLFGWMDKLGASSGAISTLRYVVNRADLDAAQFQQITESLNCLDPATTRAAFIGERSLVLARFDAHLEHLSCAYGLWGESPASRALGQVIAFFYRQAGLRDMDEAFYLHAMADAVDGAELSFSGFQRLNKELGDRADSNSRVRFLIHNVYTGYYLRRSEFRLQAMLKTAQAVLAIEQYRRFAGTLPDALDDLVPAYLGAVPSDPFDEKPLRYKKCNPGYIVYSVGEDLTNQGGISQYETENKHDPHDWPFRVVK
ncbi:MAG: hypothetical protein IH624_03395 [Phycisphaerae bacterium]|nr:hypothetical protein [Phycisphaerae bacterium]